jgi:hypothetical protein
MATPNDEPARPPAFPAWPFNCLALYTQMARDYGRYAQAVAKSTDPVETTRAEGDLGVSLWSDLMQGYYQLAIAPFAAMTTAMVEPRQSSPPPESAKPVRKVRMVKSSG